MFVPCSYLIFVWETDLEEAEGEKYMQIAPLDPPFFFLQYTKADASSTQKPPSTAKPKSGAQ